MLVREKASAGAGGAAGGGTERSRLRTWPGARCGTPPVPPTTLGSRPGPGRRPTQCSLPGHIAQLPERSRATQRPSRPRPALPRYRPGTPPREGLPRLGRPSKPLPPGNAAQPSSLPHTRASPRPGRRRRSAQGLGSPFRFQRVPGGAVLPHVVKFCPPHVSASAPPLGSRAPGQGRRWPAGRWPCPRSSVLGGEPGESSPRAAHPGSGGCPLGNKVEGYSTWGEKA